MRELIASITEREQTFPCHETTVTTGRPPEQHCAGALILLEKTGWYQRVQQIAGRMGWYDKTKLHMDSPVYDTMEEMIEAYAKRG